MAIVEGRPVLWEELTWPEAEELTQTMKMVMVPVGATEQHGPHLPLNVDTIQVDDVCKRASAKTGVPMIPTMAIGLSQSHGTFPGTLWVRSETMIRYITEICHSLYHSGVRKFVLVNGHMYNLWVLQCVRDNLRCDFDDVQCTALNYFMTTQDTKFASDAPMRKHIHANFGETAQVLALRPDLVDMEEVVDEPDYYTFFDHRFDQVSHSGIIGRNATGATAEDGEEMLESFAEALAGMLRTGLEEPIPIPEGYTGVRRWQKRSAAAAG
jgi:creatinine amidohydrolase